MQTVPVGAGACFGAIDGPFYADGGSQVALSSFSDAASNLLQNVTISGYTT